MLHEAHKRQVEETMGTFSERSEGLYRHRINPGHADIPPVPPVRRLLSTSTGGTGGKSPIW